ncbi:HipA domain-containing protein [Microbacterium sp. ZW T5_56]|uniref:HipA domain-containing protein n=1 Tax=Microbacterium sp. ZW T5_56 TaxID=3378081 RepID=UPI0038537BE5
MSSLVANATDGDRAFARESLHRTRREYLRKWSDVADVVSTERTIRHQTPTQLALLAGVPVRTVIDIEKGHPIIGNADTHAKNYSLLLRPDGASLAPLYDPVPVGLYSSYEQELAMRIAGARRPRAATPDHWRKLARRSGLDQDETVDIVAKVATGVLEHNHDAWDGLDSDQRDLLRQAVRHHAEVAIGAETAH